MQPYPHQLQSIIETETHLETEQRVLFQLSTGGGKTAYFSFLAQRFIQRTGSKVLVLAHREELITQTLSTLRTIGVTCESVVASKKSLKHLSSAYVGMVQTLKNRLSKDPNFLQDVGLIICDEAHLLFYEWIFEYYPNAKIVAVTATPVLLKKIQFSKCSRCGKIANTPEICCRIEMYEYTRDMTLSEIYENIIIGRSISELIQDGKLVQDIVYKTGSLDRSKLKVDAKTGDFENTDEEFGNENALFDVVTNYETLCRGKKTIIFNSSAKVNALVHTAFLDKGYNNVRIFDSVNSKQSERSPLLKWFKETPDAILLNVSIFTTGFDEPTVESIIINRATLSLSLYLQMVGRGGRPTDKIYKPNFTVIDGGGNVDYFAEKCKNSGKWSDYIDWKSIFYGTDKKPRPKKEVLENTTQCKNCGAIYPRNATACTECEFESPIHQRKLVFSKEVATLIDEIPKPDGIKIVDYCERIGKDKNFAWTILINQIFDLFIIHDVKKGTYDRSLLNGRYQESIRNLIKQPYGIIQGSTLEGGVLRTKAYLVTKIKQKLDKYYTE